MVDIVALCQCLPPHVTATTLRPCSRIVSAMLVMPGRVTMLGLSRWAGTGGSARTVQRFFSTVIPWATRFWGVLRQHGYRPEEVDLLGGDAVVATKAGHHTPGLDRFFASLYGTPVPGLAFCTWSLVSPPPRRSFPRRIEPVVRSAAAKAAPTAPGAAKTPPVAAPVRRRPGRPQGSKHTPKADGTHTPECGRIPGRLAAWLHRLPGGGLVDLLGPRRALRQPQRPPEGAGAAPASACQTPVRCRPLLPLRWP
jgi:hypothetical protein